MYVTVFGNAFWSSDKSRNVISFQLTNDIVHGDRVVCTGVDFGSCDWNASDSFHYTRGISVRVLFNNGRHKSSYHHGFVSSNTQKL